jgi:hypothetical protein
MFLRLIPPDERAGKQCKLCKTTEDVKFQVTTLDGDWCTKCTKYIIKAHIDEGDRDVFEEEEEVEASEPAGAGANTKNR